MRILEFYPEKQGRPYSPETRDLETGQGALYTDYVFLREENMELKELLDKLLNELITAQEELLIEAKQMKLSLNIISGQDVTSNDIDSED